MEKMNLLVPIIVFTVFLCFSLLVVPFKKGRIFAYFLNILATVSFLILVKGKGEFLLTDLVFLNEKSIKLLLIIGIFNVVLAILNGHETRRGIQNSILASFMYLGSIFLVGATEFITFFVALEMLSLIGYALVALSLMPNSKEAAVRYFIQGSIISAVFLMGVALFYGATASLSINDVQVSNQGPYIIAIALFVVTAFFKLGAFPFHSWVPDVYTHVDKGNLASNFLITKISVGYVFIMLIQRLLTECSPQIQMIFINGIITVSVISAFYGNIMGLSQNQFKRMLAYSSVAHAGYMLMTICLNPGQGYEDQLMFYLIFYSIAGTGSLLLVNTLLTEGKEEDFYDSIKGGYYRNGLLALLLSLFVLSMAGIPLTAGFTTKYLLFTNYFREGMALPAIGVLISSVIGLGFYIKFVVAMFMESPKIRGETEAIERVQVGIVELILAIFIIAGGVLPSLFLK